MKLFITILACILPVIEPATIAKYRDQPADDALDVSPFCGSARMTNPFGSTRRWALFYAGELYRATICPKNLLPYVKWTFRSLHAAADVDLHIWLNPVARECVVNATTVDEFTATCAVEFVRWRDQDVDVGPICVTSTFVVNTQLNGSHDGAIVDFNVDHFLCDRKKIQVKECESCQGYKVASYLSRSPCGLDCHGKFLCSFGYEGNSSTAVCHPDASWGVPGLCDLCTRKPTTTTTTTERETTSVIPVNAEGRHGAKHSAASVLVGAGVGSFVVLGLLCVFGVV